MKKLSLNEVKKIKYENNTWTLNGEKIFSNMLDEIYKVDFKFKIGNNEYTADYIIYAYGIGPIVQYKDEYGNDRTYPIKDLLQII